MFITPTRTNVFFTTFWKVIYPINSTPQPFPNKTIQYLHIVLACMLGIHGSVGGHTNLPVCVLYKGCPKRVCTTHCPCGMLGLQSFLHSYPLHTLYEHFGTLIHAFPRPLPRARKANTRITYMSVREKTLFSF